MRMAEWALDAPEDTRGTNTAEDFEAALYYIDLLLQDAPEFESWLDYVQEQNSHVH